MERITWSGIALHEGGNLGHPASHGCIRMSHEFAVRLWALTRVGVPVVIARSELRPEEISDPHLFAHTERPAEPVPEVSAQPIQMAAQFLKTADMVEGAAQTTPSPQTGATEPGDGAPVAAPGAAPPPPSKPTEAKHAVGKPISIFVSRKDKKIYVRQNLAPLFDAAVGIEQPDQPLGTHLFTAMEYLDDGSSFRWNVISLPAERAKPRQPQYEGRFARYARAQRADARAATSVSDAPQETPQRALARIEIPQDTIDQISELIVPGSSFIVSDQGLGDETGEGTNFIVVSH
jgi:L,D-transpeptidase catalytic domain